MLYKEALTRDEKIILYTLEILKSLVKKGVLPEEIWDKDVVVNSRKTKRILKKFSITSPEIILGLEMLDVGGFLNKKVLINHLKTMPDSFIKQLEMEIN